MKVRELEALLRDVDPEREVVLASGRKCVVALPLNDVTKGSYCACRVGFEKMTDELRALGFSDMDVIEDGTRAIVLWPTN